MLESQPQDDVTKNWESLPYDLLRGQELLLEQQVLKLIIMSYENMYENERFTSTWKENTFSAVLTNYLKKHRQSFCRLTRKNWHIEREVYNDDELISRGETDPDTATRIDIVIFTWNTEYEEIRFPFECKLIDEHASRLIRFYIKKGLIERYLTCKDYARGTSWGGMIGYILRGNHSSIVAKLNKQIAIQIKDPACKLSIYQTINNMAAIYKSEHQRSEQVIPLTITHLLLSFLPHVEEASLN